MNNADLIEFVVIVLAGIVIVSCVYELGKYILKRVEDKREQERAECWRRKQGR